MRAHTVDNGRFMAAGLLRGTSWQQSNLEVSGLGFEDGVEITCVLKDQPFVLLACLIGQIIH